MLYYDYIIRPKFAPPYRLLFPETAALFQSISKHTSQIISTIPKIMYNAQFKCKSRREYVVIHIQKVLKK